MSSPPQSKIAKFGSEPKTRRLRSSAIPSSSSTTVNKQRKNPSSKMVGTCLNSQNYSGNSTNGNSNANASMIPQKLAHNHSLPQIVRFDSSSSEDFDSEDSQGDGFSAEDEFGSATVAGGARARAKRENIRGTSASNFGLFGPVRPQKNR